MARNLDKENEEILNGNRFIVNTDEMTGTFVRDVDKLFFQYKNLRVSLYNEYRDYLQDHATQEELMSYIDEQFIRLVKEFSPNGAVDFPGYVKTKLHNRVKNSFVRSNYRNRKRIFIPRHEFDVTNLLDNNPVQDEQLDFYETLEYVLQDVKLTELERDILFLMLQELTDAEIEKNIRKKYQRSMLTNADIRETLKEVQCFVRDRLHKALEED
ncbi:RNA polymerase sigma factor [Bacillus phage Eldridge]|uniref:RNA polymerase sigma factor n=1 Tax=Bacillus phage Eldridge TaxID=1776293 RepID=A0A109QMG0_9CAUD|nr:RNA polymerase sigma factor [Bacillus phage Eldridge]AMB18711.1 RNA polymerase sigma factor [Bacillus phage Eldridge]